MNKAIFNKQFLRKTLVPFFIIIFGGLAGLLLCEVAFRLFQKLPSYQNKKIEQTSYFKFMWYDAASGVTRLRANEKIKVSSHKGNETLYEVEYQSDQFGRRVTPDPKEAGKTNKLKNKFGLFIGCSFTFGTGVDQEQTLPYYFSKSKSGFKIYNYGCPGYSTASSLLRLKNINVQKEVPEKEGFIIYPMIDAHIARTIGTVMTAGLWAQDYPYYILDGENKLVHLGTFNSGRPLTNIFYRLFAQSHILQELRFDYPSTFTDAHFKLVSRLVSEMKNEYKAKFNSDNFYVLIWPKAQEIKKLIPYFDSLGVKYLDYSDFIMPQDANKPFTLKYDQHPNAYMYEVMGKKISEDLKSL